MDKRAPLWRDADRGGDGPWSRLVQELAVVRCTARALSVVCASAGTRHLLLLLLLHRHQRLATDGARTCCARSECESGAAGGARGACAHVTGCIQASLLVVGVSVTLMLCCCHHRHEDDTHVVLVMELCTGAICAGWGGVEWGGVVRTAHARAAPRGQGALHWMRW